MNQRNFWRFAFFLSALMFCLLAPFVGRADEAVEPTEKKEVVINGKNYKLRWINGGDFAAGQNYTSTGRAELAFLWDNETVWAVDPTRLRVLKTFPSKFQVLALSPDKSCALVRNEGAPALMDVASQKISVTFEDFGAFNRWTFSPNGKFIYPLEYHGGEKTYRIIDVSKKSVVEFPVRLPQEGFWVSSIITRNGASLMVLSRSENLRSVHDRTNTVLSIPLDEPAGTSVTPVTASFEKIFAERDGRILVLLDYSYLVSEEVFIDEYQKGDYHLAWRNASTFSTVTTSRELVSERVFWVGFSPDGKDVYSLTNFLGLNIYNANTLKPINDFKAGNTFNASGIGVTFSEDGKFAFVAEPYADSFSVIDVATRKIVSTVKLRQGIAGVLPIGDECFVIPMFLPCE